MRLLNILIDIYNNIFGKCKSKNYCKYYSNDRYNCKYQETGLSVKCGIRRRFIYNG